MTNKNLLRILFIEDLLSDVDLAVLALRKEGLRFEHKRVDTKVEFIKALKEFKPDIIISDYMMPSYNGSQALKDARELDSLIPFILLTGSMNEETAVDCIKAGATDYIIKEHITRLPFSVKEALEQHRIQIEKRATELLLKESEEKLQSIFSAAPVGIGLIVNSILVEVNDAFCEMTGYGRKELIGTKGKIIFPSIEEYESIKSESNRQIAERGSVALETKLKSKNGSILSILLSTAPLDKDDLPKGVTFAVLDITERKQAEEDMHIALTKYKTLFECFPLGVTVSDEAGNIVETNSTAKILHGVPHNEQIQRDIDGPEWHIIQTDGTPMPPEKFASVRALKQRCKVENVEMGIVKSDNTITWINVTANPLPLKGYGVVITYNDITARKLGEKVIRDCEEKYRRIFENVQDVYYEVLIDGTIIGVSPSINIMSKGQYHSEDLIGKSMWNFYSEPKERQALLAILQENGTVKDFEIALKNRDGSHIPCSISAKICLNDQGRPKKIIGSMHDITDRKNAIEKLKLAKEKAEASDKLKTTFLNNISHEVRTPLNGILGFAEIISQTGLSEEDKKVSFSMLYDSSDRLLSTITNYMDISMLASGTMSLYKKDFLPDLVLREILAKYKTICSIKNLELSLKIPEQGEELSIHSDPEILKKIVSHLLNNAVKFTEKGSIVYGYLIHGKELEFFVKDAGIGIAKESLKDIFENFIKEDRGPLKITEGSGLGLSISKGLVELLEGKIRVESEKGKGSCFFFTVPAEKEFEDHNISQPVSKQKRNKTTNSILVAEDDETNFFCLKALLKQNTSAKIIHASNGKEAIENFLQNPDIGLILMDIKMPVMDGLEATRQIKAVNKDVPVIAITAYAMTGDEALITEAGCDCYITKPVDKKLLLKKMAEYIIL